MSEVLHIDWTACEGRGLCVELLPEVLGGDEWGYPIARDGAREPAVPDALLPYARRAVAHCPRLALRLKAAPAAPTPPAARATAAMPIPPVARASAAVR